MRYEELTIEGRNAVMEAFPLRQDHRQALCAERLSGRPGKQSILREAKKT